MESSFVPFGAVFVNLIKKLNFKSILFVPALSLEFEVSVGEIDFFIFNVHDRNLKIDFIFSLSPFDERMKPNIV